MSRMRIRISRAFARTLRGAKRVLLPGLDPRRLPVPRPWMDFLEAEAAKRDFVADVLGHRMYLDDRDSLGLSVHKVFEPVETRFFQRILRSGHAVVDIGANIGYFTLLFARSVGPTGRVFAFEPEPRNFELLRRNVASNGYGNVIALAKAAWCASASLDLFISEGNRGDHRVCQPGDGRKSVRIEAIRLDDYFSALDDPIDLVKMDIQGAECRALEGMSALLRRNRDVVLVTEFWPLGLTRAGTPPTDLFAQLRELGFAVYVLADDGSLGQADLEALLDAPALQDEGYVNLVCARGELP